MPRQNSDTTIPVRKGNNDDMMVALSDHQIVNDNDDGQL